MRIAQRIADWIERAFDSRGLIYDDHYDPLATALAPYEHDHSRYAVLDTIFAELHTREGCPHWSASAVELETAVFHCRDCGLTYRHKVDPAKPWIIVGYEPVKVAS